MPTGNGLATPDPLKHFEAKIVCFLVQHTVKTQWNSNLSKYEIELHKDLVFLSLKFENNDEWLNICCAHLINSWSNLLYWVGGGNTYTYLVWKIATLPSICNNRFGWMGVEHFLKIWLLLLCFIHLVMSFVYIILMYFNLF